MRKRDFKRQVEAELAKWEHALRRKKNSHEEEIEIISERISFLKELVVRQIPDEETSCRGYRLALNKEKATIKRDFVEIDLNVLCDGAFVLHVSTLMIKPPDTEEMKELLQEYGALKDERRRKKRLRKKVMAELNCKEEAKRRLSADLYTSIKGA